VDPQAIRIFRTVLEAATGVLDEVKPHWPGKYGAR
jgi:hypothetical protein